MSYRSSNGNLAIMYAHSFTHYCIMISTKKQLSRKWWLLFQSETLWCSELYFLDLFLNQMQVQLFHMHDAFTLGYVSSLYYVRIHSVVFFSIAFLEYFSKIVYSIIQHYISKLIQTVVSRGPIESSHRGSKSFKMFFKQAILIFKQLN